MESLDHFKDEICSSLNVVDFEIIEQIQELWSGYGAILRLKLSGGDMDTVIAKHIQLPKQAKHPRGWNTNISHERKLKSYEVETAWYSEYAGKCDSNCRVAKTYLNISIGDESLLILEDLDASGFPLRKTKLKPDETKVVLSWLAHFHARFLNIKPNSLWKKGTYWHLNTRREEWNIMKNGKLKENASKLDSILNSSKYQTLVHGDAKVANFCFSENLKETAAVDFQYVGAGCGIKDVAYFLGSCLNETECAKQEEELLTFYLSILKSALKDHHVTVDIKELEAEWRFLYPIAWTDFYRFLEGWMPNHWKINSYTKKLANKAFHQIESIE